MEQVSTPEESPNPLLDRPNEPGPPETNYESKMVMLRAEQGDSLHVTDVYTQIKEDASIPSSLSVKKRTTPYFGPKLRLTNETRAYLLTAPGPDTQLLLWIGNQTNSGDRYGWQKLAEVSVQFDDEQPRYDLCPVCGDPMQTIEHQRKAAVGRCPGPD